MRALPSAFHSAMPRMVSVKKSDVKREPWLACSIAKVISFELGALQIVWPAWSVGGTGFGEKSEMPKQPCTMYLCFAYTTAQPPWPDFALVSLQVEALENVLFHRKQ